MLEPVEAGPTVTDVTFRINDAGDLFVMELGCAGGAAHSVSLSSTALVKLIAGAVWTAAEAGRRRAVPALSPRLRTHMLANAPSVDSIGGAFEGPDPVVEFQVGAAPVALKLPRAVALALAERLVDALHPAARV